MYRRVLRQQASLRRMRGRSRCCRTCGARDEVERVLRHARALAPALAHELRESTDPPAELARRDALSHRVAFHLQDVAEHAVRQEPSHVLADAFEAILKEATRIVHVLGEVGVFKRRLGPRVAVVQEVEKDKTERPNVGLARVIRRPEVVATFCATGDISEQSHPAVRERRTVSHIRLAPAIKVFAFLLPRPKSPIGDLDDDPPIPALAFIPAVHDNKVLGLDVPMGDADVVARLNGATHLSEHARDEPQAFA